MWSLPTFGGFCVTGDFPKGVQKVRGFCPRSTMSTKREGPVHPWGLIVDANMEVA